MQRRPLLSQREPLWKKLFRVFAFLSILSSNGSRAAKSSYSVDGLSGDLVINKETGREIFRPDAKDSTLVCFEGFKTENSDGFALGFRVYDFTGEDKVTENFGKLSSYLGCENEESDGDKLGCILTEGPSRILYDSKAGKMDRLVQVVDYDECIKGLGLK